MSVAIYCFLDFDGVLHPNMSGSFSKLPRFEEFLRAHPEILVVLSTSWRTEHPFEDLVALFSSDLRDRIISKTPALSFNVQHQRYQEILAWRRENRVEQLPWFALDDLAELFPPFCPQLVLCETPRGFGPAQAQVIRSRFGWDTRL